MLERYINWEEVYKLYTNGRDALGIEMKDHYAQTVLGILPQEGPFEALKWIYKRHLDKFGDRELAIRETGVDIALGLACTTKGWLDEKTLPLASVLSGIIGDSTTGVFERNVDLYRFTADDSGSLSCGKSESSLNIPSPETGPVAGTLLPSSSATTITTTKTNLLGRKTVTRKEL